VRHPASARHCFFLPSLSHTPGKSRTSKYHSFLSHGLSLLGSPARTTNLYSFEQIAKSTRRENSSNRTNQAQLPFRILPLAPYRNRLAPSVKPGRTECRKLKKGIFSDNISQKRASGRGPTRLISPRNTLNNWGTSSSRSFRKNRRSA